MKIQLNLDLGNIDWSAKSPLDSSGTCCCFEVGKAACDCGKGKTLKFQIVPVKASGESEPACCQAEISCE